jgi:hypothetical protein
MGKKFNIGKRTFFERLLVIFLFVSVIKCFRIFFNHYFLEIEPEIFDIVFFLNTLILCVFLKKIKIR